jgi:CRP/FNR family cyclic AMP-dependent transcriptional regulator
MHTVRIELLQQMPIFGAISEQALGFLLEPAAEVRVAAGSFFFREGEPAQSMYVLETGRVAILKSWDGRDLLLRELGEGDCIGEMALLDLFPRSASVQALEDCTAIELTAAHLMRLYEHDLEQFALIQMNLAREMSRRLRVTDDLLFRARMGEPPATPSAVFRST